MVKSLGRLGNYKKTIGYYILRLIIFTKKSFEQTSLTAITINFLSRLWSDLRVFCLKILLIKLNKKKLQSMLKDALFIWFLTQYFNRFCDWSSYFN